MKIRIFFVILTISIFLSSYAKAVDESVLKNTLKAINSDALSEQNITLINLDFKKLKVFTDGEQWSSLIELKNEDMKIGLSSGASLATVVGVLIEVPVMLMLVSICKRTCSLFKKCHLDLPQCKVAISAHRNW